MSCEVSTLVLGSEPHTLGSTTCSFFILTGLTRGSSRWYVQSFLQNNGFCRFLPLTMLRKYFVRDSQSFNFAFFQLILLSVSTAVIFVYFWWHVHNILSRLFRISIPSFCHVQLDREFRLILTIGHSEPSYISHVRWCLRFGMCKTIRHRCAVYL